MATRLAGATQDEVRRSNLASLVRILHEQGALSRSELVARTGLNRSTVGTLTTELAGWGLVQERSGSGGGVGRPSIRVEPQERTTYVLAVDLRVDRTIAALVGLGGSVLVRREERRFVDLGNTSVSADALIRRTLRLCRAVLALAPAGAHCVGVGVGVPGLVRSGDGLVRAAPNLGWTDVPLGERLTSRLGLDVPVVIGNDSDLGALAERLRGSARGASNVVFLAGQIGVGGGVIVDGRPLGGAGGYAGEVGHTRVNPRGRLCHCGARGCWETEVGELALLLAARRATEGGTTSDVVAAALSGDVVARRALDKVGHWLGVGVGNLVNVFNPEVVVFGGTLREVFVMSETAVRRSLSASLRAPLEQVRLELPELGDDSTLIGAAEAAFAPLLDDPLSAAVIRQSSARIR
ncbi:MAG TPA: ROK family protein [Candidatus Nanopelagicales bacterium]